MEAENIEIYTENVGAFHLCEEGGVGVLHAHNIIVKLGKEESDDKGMVLIVQDGDCI